MYFLRALTLRALKLAPLSPGMSNNTTAALVVPLEPEPADAVGASSESSLFLPAVAVLVLFLILCAAFKIISGQ